jgi:hypothetical protein
VFWDVTPHSYATNGSEKPAYTIFEVSKRKTALKLTVTFEVSSSHGVEYEVQNCFLGCTAV